MNLDIQQKTALVTGAGGGLGSAIARTLAKEGAHVVIADIDAAALAQTEREIQAEGGEVMALVWDLADLSAIPGNMEAIKQRFGTVDILLNNTGGPPPTPASGQSPATWEQQFRAMVLSVISLTDSVLPGMRQKKWGRVITSTSSGVIAPIANLAMSNALRMSLLGWSKTLAREVGPDGITVNVILPGRIATDRIRFLDKSKSEREGRTVESVMAESTATIPLQRYGMPEEYANAVAFLASCAASYVTGTVMRVDGGLIASV